MRSIIATTIIAVFTNGGILSQTKAQTQNRELRRKPLTLTHPKTGIKIMVIQEAFPLLKILLPGQSLSERGIEVEFPEHVWGRHQTTKDAEQLYMVALGRAGDAGPSPSTPVWRLEGNALSYVMDLKNKVKMVARAQLESDGVRFSYEFANHSDSHYEYFQPVTCVKLYSTCSDTFLERTYIHHPEGFDLLASETPDRLMTTI